MMHSANTALKHLKPALIILLALTMYRAAGQNSPLPNAFAHNDYWHKRPLYDALDNGYAHVEADIYLRRNKLIVAHILPLFKNRTLEQLYLKPLADWYKGANKTVTNAPFPIVLMVDIKSGSDRTYDSLCVVLNRYKPILSGYENGRIIRRQITVVLTGHRPKKLYSQPGNRMVFIDEDLIRAVRDTVCSGLYQTASCRYSRLVNWQGDGNMPDSVRIKLCRYIKAAHQNGAEVRLWDAPEKESVWQELLKCGVDLINTDKLVALRNFLIRQKKNPSNIYTSSTL